MTMAVKDMNFVLPLLCTLLYSICFAMYYFRPDRSYKKHLLIMSVIVDLVLRENKINRQSRFQMMKCKQDTKMMKSKRDSKDSGNYSYQGTYMDPAPTKNIAKSKISAVVQKPEETTIKIKASYLEPRDDLPFPVVSWRDWIKETTSLYNSMILNINQELRHYYNKGGDWWKLENLMEKLKVNRKAVNGECRIVCVKMDTN